MRDMSEGKKTHNINIWRNVLRVAMTAWPLVVGIALGVVPHWVCGNSTLHTSINNVALSLASGFVVYFFTVNLPDELKIRKLKKVLHKRHQFFKKCVITILLDAEGLYSPEQVDRCLDPDYFKSFVVSRRYADQSHLDAMMNGLNEHPEKIVDLNAEIDFFFSGILLLAANANVSANSLNRLSEYASSFKRMRVNSVLKSDIENLVDCIAECFSDWSHVDGSQCGIEHALETI